MFKKLAESCSKPIFFKQLFLSIKPLPYKRLPLKKQLRAQLSRLSQYATIVSFWPIILAEEMEWIPKIEFKDPDGDQVAVTAFQKLKLLEHVKNLLEVSIFQLLISHICAHK